MKFKELVEEILSENTYIKIPNHPTYGDKQLAHIRHKGGPRTNTVGRSLIEPYPGDNKFYGENVVRIETRDPTVFFPVKIDLKKEKIYFLDEKYLKDTDQVKWDRPLKYTELIIQNNNFYKYVK